MDKFVAVVFPDQEKAYDGLRRVKRLHADGNISLYDWEIIEKNASGEVSVRDTDDRGPLGTAVGALAGALIGLLGGPAGAAIGYSGGAMLGMFGDLRNIDVSEDFVTKVANEMTPGRCALVAELEETWVTPLDVEMDAAGGVIMRETRLMFEDEKAEREAAARRAELEALKSEWSKASAERRANLDKRMAEARGRLQATAKSLEKRAHDTAAETQRRIDTLKRQLADAHESRKKDIERNMTEIGADLDAREAKLTKAIALTNEALSPINPV